MPGIWKRRTDRIDALLRGHAPRPNDEFARTLERTVNESTGRSPRRRSSFAFISAVAVIVLGVLASTGGLGYAASGATAAKEKIVRKSSAQDEYGSQTAVTPPATKVASASASKPPPSTVASASGGTLPFTGLSIAGTVVIGLSLIGVGLALRRRERRE
jgi:hypothetical protein